MKGHGIFRRVVTRAKQLFNSPVTHVYKDPVFTPKVDGYKKSRRKKQPRIKKSFPCGPGDLAYHDKLVAHFGARFANDFRRRYIKHKRTRETLVLPTDQEFIDNPPWAFLATQRKG